MRRQRAHERGDFFRGVRHAGRVGGAGQKHQPGVRRDRGEERRRVLLQARAERHLDRLGAEHQRHELIDHEGRRVHHALAAGREEGVAEQFDEFVGAVADDELVHAEAELLR